MGERWRRPDSAVGAPPRCVGFGGVNRLRIHALGPVDVRLDGARLDLGTRKQRALFVLLLVNRGRVVSIDRIIAMLWGPNAPGERRRDVYVYVSRLRRALAPLGELIHRAEDGYVLTVDDDVVDSVRFEALVAEGRSLLDRDPAAASLVLGEALAAWTGAALGEFGVEDFAVAEAVRLEELRLLALEAQAEGDLAWRDLDDLIPELEGLVAAHPARAALAASLMLALYRRGRQTEALAVYARFATELAEQNGLSPPKELQRLEEQILLDDPILNPPQQPRLGSVPEPVASFVGRSEELAEVAKSLVDHRLVTVTGLGGVGKTTLCFEVARRLALVYDDVAVVDFTPASGDSDLMATVARALRIDPNGGRPIDLLRARVGNRRVLLVWDNCEAVATEAGRSAVALLQEIPGMRIVTTSRIVLGVAGERIVRLDPMGTEPGGDAERLLSERIAALPSDVAEAVGDSVRRQLCVKTAGLPLAIELAVGQLRSWPAEDVAAALEDPSVSLESQDRVGPVHHRDLRASMAWSERLLTADESVLLARLSVFRSSFSHEAAVAVAGFEPLDDVAALDSLRRLVEASLVAMDPAKPARFSLLEPVRQYAARELRSAGEADALATRHAGHYADVVARLGSAIDLGTESDALDLGRLEAANIMGALEFALAAGDADLALRIAVPAVPLWRHAGSMREALPAIDAVLAMDGGSQRARAELLLVAGPFYAVARGKATWLQSVELLASLSAELDDPEVTAWALLRSADGADPESDPELVLKQYQASVDALLELRSPLVGRAFHQMAWFQYWLWDRPADTAATVAAWLAVARAAGWRRDESLARSLASWLGLATRDFAVAEDEAAASADILRELGDHRSAALGMFPMAVGSLQNGDLDEAANRADVAVSASEEFGSTLWAMNARLTRACIAIARGDTESACEDLNAVAAETAAPEAEGLAAVAVRALVGMEPDTAAELLGAVAAQSYGRRSLGFVERLPVPALDAIVGEPGPALHAALGTEGYEVASQRGALLTGAETLALIRRAVGTSQASARSRS